MVGLPSWPVFSPGSLNAWLVFLGPSPGNSPGSSWNYDPLPSVGGAHGGVAEYVDRRGFWNGIRKFARTIFPELSPTDVYAATMVRNLDPEQSATGPTGGHMYPAAIQVTEVLGKLIRPRWLSHSVVRDSTLTEHFRICPVRRTSTLVRSSLLALATHVSGFR